MGLKALTFPTRVVKTSGGDFAVRGLWLDDVMGLAQRHGPMLEGLFLEFVGQSASDQAIPRGAFAALMIGAPAVAAEIICLACGESDSDLEALSAARSLPAGIQLEVLEAAAALTFASEGGPGNVARLVVRAVQGTTSLITDLRT